MIRKKLQNWRWLFPVLLLAVIAGLYTPVQLYLNNRSTFQVTLIQMVPAFLVTFAAVLAAGVGIGLLILYWGWIREKLGEHSYFAFGALVALSFVNLTKSGLIPVAVLPLIGLAAGLVLRKWDNDYVFGALIALAIANWVQSWCPGLVPPLIGLAAGLLLRKWEKRYTYLIYGAVLVAGLMSFIQNKYPLITLFVWGVVLGMTLRKRISPMEAFEDIVFGLALAVACQVLLSNTGLTVLSNSQPKWNNQSTGAVLSLHLWGLCLILPSVLRLIDEKLLRAVKLYGSAALTVAAIAWLAVSVLRADLSPFPVVTKDDEFLLSSKKNVVVFLVDSLDAQYVEDYVLPEDMRRVDPVEEAAALEEDAADESGEALAGLFQMWLKPAPEEAEAPSDAPQYYVLDEEIGHELLGDFTYFDNVVSGGAPNTISIPTLLTGTPYSPEYESTDQYYEEAYGSFPLFRDLRKKGYSVRLYTNQSFVKSIDDRIIDNIRTDIAYKEKSFGVLLENLFRQTGYYAMPYQLKNTLWTPGNRISNNVVFADAQTKRYSVWDSTFYNDLTNQGLTVDDQKKCFVIYHLRGAVSPYRMNENCAQVDEKNTTRSQQIAGVFKLINEYVQQMKAEGVYDNSTIIIAGTNGDLELGQNPAVFIKRRNKSGKFVRNSKALTFDNLRASFVTGIVKNPKKKYGYNMFNQPEDEAPLLREHVAGKNYWQKLYKEKSSSWRAFRILDEAAGLENILKTVEGEPYACTLDEWIPLCGIDAVTDFPITGLSIDEGDFRWTLGQDVTLGFALEAPEKDVVFRMDYAGTINGRQRVQVFVNDHPVYDEVATDAGIIQFMIPVEYAPEGIYNIVMKLPDAASPMELGYSEDNRHLGLKVTGCGLYAARNYMYPLTMGTYVSLCGADAVPDFPVIGLSFDEGLHRWTDGDRVQIALRARGMAKDAVFRLYCEGTFLEQERVQCYVNGHLLGQDVLSGAGVFECAIPKEYAPRGFYDICIRLPDAVSPAELWGGEDPRRLALKLSGVELVAANGD